MADAVEFSGQNHEGHRMTTWIDDAIFYHIYPLGLLDAPAENDHRAEPISRLADLAAWGGHARSLGCNAIYLGPVFESSTHGYDTVDYHMVDRRLGTNDDLRALIAGWHDLGLKVVLDGVFNHVSREFPAFEDLLAHGESSAYRDWFAGIDFGVRSPRGDAFTYDAWAGNYELARLDLANPDVRAYHFASVRMWFEAFEIDGIRIDTADVIDLGFLHDLAAVARAAQPDCWLMGEVVHEDYGAWTAPGMLDSCTNYECFKGLYSSFNDRNMYEIAWSLNRQFGPDGIYRDLRLYTFADNHDVNRVASLLNREGDLAPLYALLFTMPGVPSIYYGSEWGITGEKREGNDRVLRPALTLPPTPEINLQPWLPTYLALLAEIRVGSPALTEGDYTQVHVASEQFAFFRRKAHDVALVAVNAGGDEVALALKGNIPDGTVLIDRLDPTVSATVHGGALPISLAPGSARILTVGAAPHRS